MKFDEKKMIKIGKNLEIPNISTQYMPLICCQKNVKLHRE